MMVMSVIVGIAACIAGLVLAWRRRLLQRTFHVPPPASCAVLVTGVSGGLGEAFALDLAKQGYLVLGTVRKQKDADALTEAGVIRPILLDVSNPDAFSSALKDVRAILQKESRTLGALVNNAGITGMDKTRELDTEIVGAEHYERVFSTNVFGLVRAAETFLPLLKETPGARIINIGSYFGNFAPGAGYSAQYVSSKFAVEGLTDVWRRALKANGVAVTLVKPGDYSTKMNPLPGASKDLTSVVEAVRDSIVSPQPLARYYPGKVVKVGLSNFVLCHLLNVLPDRLVDMVL